MAVFKNYLQVLQHCDHVTPDTSHVSFRLCDGTQVGTILPVVMDALASYNQTVTPAPFVLTGDTMTFADHLQTMDQRTKAVSALMDQWRQDKTFPALAGWRDELYAVYGSDGRPAFVMERAATPLLGVATFGVHINAFTRDTHGKIKMWVARRAATKPTWPNCLDNCVRRPL
jgi:hypothetical protein